jgi:hypothetical protein
MVVARSYVVWALGMLLAGGALAMTADGARAPTPELKPPALLSPGPSQSIQVGSALVFRIRTHVRDGGLVLRVSRSGARKKCGVIAGDIAQYSFVRTGTPAVYKARVAGATLPNSWLNTPGTYYWQAYRIAGADGCIESKVRVLRIVPKPPLELAAARFEGVFEVDRQTTAVDGFPGLSIGNVEKSDFTFRPSCGAGACDVQLSFEGPGLVFSQTISLPLTRAGAGYSGTTAASLSKCSFASVEGTLEFRLEVSGGEWIGGVWRATRLVGFERYSTPEKDLGIQKCPPAFWERSLTGALQSGEE